MAAHPDVPEDVLNAAIAYAGEIRRHYPHGDSDFRTDVSHMLYRALSAWVTPIKGYRDLPVRRNETVLEFRQQHPNYGRDTLSEGGN